MEVLTWNLEYSPPRSHRGRLIREAIEAINPDVVCYTEVLRDFVPDGHCVEADAGYGYRHNGSRRKVILWSKEPWEEVEVVGDEVLPGGRFASGICQGIRFVGVCIPWRDAHVTSGREDRARWEDHLL